MEIHRQTIMGPLLRRWLIVPLLAFVFSPPAYAGARDDCKALFPPRTATSIYTPPAPFEHKDVCHRNTSSGTPYLFVRYIKDTRTPLFVIYKLDQKRAQDANNQTMYGRKVFRPDPQLALAGIVQAKDSDYRSSGLDKGHLAPSKIMQFDAEAWIYSYLFSNVAPQDRDLNQHLWKELEQYVRKWIAQRSGTNLSGKSIHVVTGVHFEDATPPATKPGREVRVPTGFFKVIYDVPAKAGIAFYAANQSPGHNSIKVLAMKVEDLKAKLGKPVLGFFPEKDNSDAAHWNLPN